MGHLIDRRRLKERGVYCHNGDKLNQTNKLSAKILSEFKNSRIFTPSIIDMSWQFRDISLSLKSQCLCQNPCSGLLCCHL